jgi:hypothetical protein
LRNPWNAKITPSPVLELSSKTHCPRFIPAPRTKPSFDSTTLTASAKPSGVRSRSNTRPVIVGGL